MSSDDQAVREKVRAFLKDYFEKNRWFADRVSRELGFPLDGNVGLGITMVVPDPEREGGLMVAMHTDDMISFEQHGPLLVIAEEAFTALRERHPDLAERPLRAHIVS